MSHQATDTVPLLEGLEQLCCGKLRGLMAQLQGTFRNFPKLFRLTRGQEGTGEWGTWKWPLWVMLFPVFGLS